MKIDLRKRYATRGGVQVELEGIDPTGEFPVRGKVKVDGAWRRLDWKLYGFYTVIGDSVWDLVEVPEPIEVQVFVNVYANGSQYFHHSREAADRVALPFQKHYGLHRIACIERTIEGVVGEGL